MKINMPITNKEVMFDESEYMMTKTDLKGVITFANQSFIKISGFTEAELVGQSHNVVRHPDMPVEAFEDLWRNLKSDKPWTGLVKNRTKDGDYYWVSASVTPFIVNGQIAGYTSVRGKPSRDQVSATESAYRLFKENKAQGLLIRNGKVVKNSLVYRLKDKLLKFNISSRLLGLAGFSVLVSAFLAGMGLYGMYKINTESRANYDEHVQSPIKLTLINKDLLEIRSHIYATLATAIPSTDKSKSRILDKTTVTKEVEYIDEKMTAIDKLWGEYKTGNKMPEDVALLSKFDSSYSKYDTEVLKPVIAALSALDYDVAVKASLSGRELFKVIETDMGAITDMEVSDAEESLITNESHYKRLLFISAFTLCISTLLLIWLGFAITRSVTKPLKKIIEVFEAISYGKLNTAIDSEGDNELSHVLDQLKSTQTMIGADLNVQAELASHVAEQSTQYENQLAAISKSTGVIEFSMDGNVIFANDILLKVLGYSLSEAIGQHHSSFVDANYRNSAEYKAFWEKLNRGESITGEFQRVGKNGKEIWLQASYNPILCSAGKPYKVVKYATDITEQKLKNADFEGQMTAIGKSQGVIEVCLDGIVIKVNQVYLDMLGYQEHELLGKHVSMVLDPTFAKSDAYKALWAKLVAGGTDSGQYKRIAKGGREVWIQASYNPIYDLKGKPYKIVNYTMDITGG
jgi:methyl-accepting chemotaxis protein